MSRVTQALLAAVTICICLQYYRLGYLHVSLGHGGADWHSRKAKDLTALGDLVTQMELTLGHHLATQISGPGGAPSADPGAQMRHVAELLRDASRLAAAVKAAGGSGDGSACVGSPAPARSSSPASSLPPSRAQWLTQRVLALQQAKGVAAATEAEAMAHRRDIQWVATRASKGTKNVLVTYANIHSKDLLLNWVAHIVALNVSNFLVLAMDTDMLALCARMGIPVYLMEMMEDEANRPLLADVSDKDKAHLTQYDLLRLDHNAFRRMGMLKCDILLQLLTTGHDVLFSDTDTVWMRNPWPYLESTSLSANILVSTDCLSHVRDEGLKMPDGYPWDRCGHAPGRFYGNAFNTGVLFVRASDESRRFVARWKKKLLDALTEPEQLANPMDDQLALNALLEPGMYPIRPFLGDARVFPAGGLLNNATNQMETTVRLGTLPTVQFANGHVFFHQRLHRRYNFLPYVVHVTFTNGGMAGKINRLREAHLWEMDDDSYYEQGLFVRPHIPQHLEVLGDGNATVDTHMLVVREQLLGIRNALAIARALNRTLIMPRTSCHCSRDCPTCQILPACKLLGSDVSAPFECPLDELFDVAHLVSLNITFRENSFLENFRTPKAVRDSRVVVMVKPKSLVDSLAVTQPQNAQGRPSPSYPHIHACSRAHYQATIIAVASWCCRYRDKLESAWQILLSTKVFNHALRLFNP
eukprot:jgi/Mesvir1/2362/Mv22122-RA.3